MITRRKWACHLYLFPSIDQVNRFTVYNSELDKSWPIRHLIQIWLGILSAIYTWPASHTYLFSRVIACLAIHISPTLGGITMNWVIPHWMDTWCKRHHGLLWPDHFPLFSVGCTVWLFCFWVCCSKKWWVHSASSNNHTRLTLLSNLTWLPSDLAWPPSTTLSDICQVTSLNNPLLSNLAWPHQMTWSSQLVLNTSTCNSTVNQLHQAQTIIFCLFYYAAAVNHC